MRTFAHVFCLVFVASVARAQTSEDEARCLSSGGIEWDGAKPAPPRCTCPRGMWNAIRAGGVCDKWKPHCDKCVPAGVSGHTRVIYQDRVSEGTVVRESRPLVTSPHITLNPQTARAQPEGSIRVVVRATLEGFRSLAVHAQSAGNHCLVREAESRWAEQVVTSGNPETTIIVGSGREGDCLLSVIAKGATTAYAEGLYTFRGAKLLDGAPPRRQEHARIGVEACQEFCESWDDEARWIKTAPRGKQCEPTDPERFLAAECTILPKVHELLPPNPDTLCEMQCAGLGDAARWVADDPRGVRCEPTDPERFLAGPCTIVPKSQQQDPRVVCALVCEGFGGQLTEQGCQCPDGVIAEGECACKPRFAKPRQVFHIGGELRLLGLAVQRGHEGLYVPIGITPSLVLRFDPWGPGTDFVLGVGPLITGNGGETEGTPVGVALMAGVYWGGPGWSPFGLEVDSNWYALDRVGEAYAFSLGARAPVFRWKWKLRRGECHAGGGIGGAYLLPEEMAAFIWGLSAGCTTP